MAPVSLALLGLAFHGAGLAQTPDRSAGNTLPADAVTWTATASSSLAVKPGSRLSITLQGAVLDGWHVYGLEQPAEGPIPLLVTLDASPVAATDGAPTASPPTKFHDPSFNLDTQFYSKAFTVTLPVRVAPAASTGAQQIPVSVRFQSCNGPTCRPPKTVHLTASVNVRAGG
jgi:hypothetical protein